MFQALHCFGVVHVSITRGITIVCFRTISSCSGAVTATGAGEWNIVFANEPCQQLLGGAERCTGKSFWSLFQVGAQAGSHRLPNRRQLAYAC